MKRIDAFIQPHRLTKVVNALHALPQFPGFSVLDTHGQGRGRGAGGHFAYEPDEGLLYHKHCLLIVICADEDVATISSAIVHAAHTGKNGDGVVTISEVLRIIRIRDAGGGT